MFYITAVLTAAPDLQQSSRQCAEGIPVSLPRMAIQYGWIVKKRSHEARIRRNCRFD